MQITDPDCEEFFWLDDEEEDDDEEEEEEDDAFILLLIDNPFADDNKGDGKLSAADSADVAAGGDESCSVGKWKKRKFNNWIV